MRLSTGFGFADPQHWAARKGAWENDTRWLAGDFDGNGLTDVAGARNDAIATSVAVWPSSGAGFPAHTQWATRDGSWSGTEVWTAGDFDGNGRDDLAAVWNSGVSTIAVRSSNGASFTASQWMQNAGGWSTETVWCSGRFTPI